MPALAPIASSGREPKQRTRPIPKEVRTAIAVMVFGRIDDPDCAPLSMIDAAKEAQMKPDVLRRWLDRPQVRAHLLAERRAFRAAICAGNEGALRRVRDESKNGMVTVAAVRALEQLDAEDTSRVGTAQQQAPGIVIVVHQPIPAPTPTPTPPPPPMVNAAPR